MQLPNFLLLLVALVVAVAAHPAGTPETRSVVIPSSNSHLKDVHTPDLHSCLSQNRAGCSNLDHDDDYHHSIIDDDSNLARRTPGGDHSGKAFGGGRVNGLEDQKKDKLSRGAIIGLAIAAVVAAFIVFGVLAFCFRRFLPMP